MIPAYIPFSRRQEVSRSWHKAKERKRIARGVDAETLRSRSLHDARGIIVRHGCNYYATGEVHWEMRRSRRGRTNQLDYLENGAVELTSGKRRMPV